MVTGLAVEWASELLVAAGIQTGLAAELGASTATESLAATSDNSETDARNRVGERSSQELSKLDRLSRARLLEGVQRWGDLRGLRTPSFLSEASTEVIGEKTGSIGRVLPTNGIDDAIADLIPQLASPFVDHAFGDNASASRSTSGNAGQTSRGIPRAAPPAIVITAGGAMLGDTSTDGFEPVTLDGVGSSSVVDTAFAGNSTFADPVLPTVDGGGANEGGDGLGEVARGSGQANAMGPVTDCDGNVYADANHDGFVDVSDFNIWNNHKGQSGTTFEQGDFNSDGQTNAADFDVWNQFRFQVAPQEGNVHLEVVHLDLGESVSSTVTVEGVNASGHLHSPVEAFGGGAISEGDQDTICVSGDLSGGLTFLLDTDNVGFGNYRTLTGEFGLPLGTDGFGNPTSASEHGDAIFLEHGDDFQHVVSEVYGALDPDAIATEITDYLDNGIVALPNEDDFLVLFDQGTTQGVAPNYLNAALLVETDESVRVQKADYYLDHNVFAEGEQILGKITSHNVGSDGANYGELGLRFASDGVARIREMRVLQTASDSVTAPGIRYDQHEMVMRFFSESEYFAGNDAFLGIDAEFPHNTGYVSSGAGVSPDVAPFFETATGSTIAYDFRYDVRREAALPAANYVVTLAGDYSQFNNGFSRFLFAEKDADPNAYVFSQRSSNGDGTFEETPRQEVTTNISIMMGLITERIEIK